MKTVNSGFREINRNSGFLSGIEFGFISLFDGLV